MSRHDQKAQTKQRIVEAAGRTFRKSGFNGAGVDGLAKAAGVTSGAFYVHFASKSEAFHESIVLGMQELQEGIQHVQLKHGESWWREFVHFYLTEKRMCDLSDGCALQALMGEVVRSDASAKKIFENALDSVCWAIIDGPHSLGKPSNMAEAYVALANLAGGVSLARAAASPEISLQIASAIERQLVPEESI